MSSPLLQVKLIFSVGFFFASPPVLPDRVKKIYISSYDFEGYYGPYFFISLNYLDWHDEGSFPLN